MYYSHIMSDYYKKYIDPQSEYMRNTNSNRTPPGGGSKKPCRLCYGKCLIKYQNGTNDESYKRIVAILTEPDFGGYMNMICSVYNKIIIKHITEEPYGSPNVDEWEEDKWVPTKDDLGNVMEWKQVTSRFRDWNEIKQRQRAAWVAQMRQTYLK